MIIMIEIKGKIITIKGNIEERKELEEEEEMNMVCLEVAAEVTLEIRTTKEKEIVVPAERETTAETPEIVAQA